MSDLQQKIQEGVLERVESGTVMMRSRAVFVARAALTIVVALIVLSLSAYVLSFIAFSIHESGEQFLLGFGTRGMQTFLALFPWIAFAIDIVLILFLEWLLRSFKFGYRASLLTLLGAVIVVTAFIATAISLTPLHSSLLDMADRGVLPVIGEVYESIRDSHADHGVFRGTITSIEDDRISITHDDRDHDADDGARIVILPAGYSTTTLGIGERVYVFGSLSNGVVRAAGVKKLGLDQ